MIKAVIFDAGDVTLVNRPMLQDIVKEFGLRREDIAKKYQILIKQHAAGKISEKEFWRLFKKRFKVTRPIPRPSPLVKNWTRHAVEKDDVIKLVTRLKRNGYKVGLLSSTIPAHVKHMRKIGFLKNFDEAILSYEVGTDKPNAKIYRIALKKLGVLPGEAVFIDDKEENVKGAQKIRIKGIVFKDAKQLRKELRKLDIDL